MNNLPMQRPEGDPHPHPDPHLHMRSAASPSFIQPVGAACLQQLASWASCRVDSSPAGSGSSSGALGASAWGVWVRKLAWSTRSKSSSNLATEGAKRAQMVEQQIARWKWFLLP